MEPMLVMLLIGRLELGLVVLRQPDCVPVSKIGKLLEAPIHPSGCLSLPKAGAILLGSLALDTRRATLTYTPNTGHTPPVLVRLLRERRWRALGVRTTGGRIGLTSPRYAALGTAGVHVSQSSETGPGGTKGRASVYGAGELLYGTTRGSVQITDRKVTAIRGTWSRRGPGHQFTAGDVNVGSEHGRYTEGRGASLYVGARGRHSRMWETTITGSAPGPGWNAELYLGATLVDAKKLEGTRYTFVDVPTRAGRNVATVKLYGPAGEIITRDHSLHVGARALPPGKITAALALHQPNRPTFGPAHRRDTRRHAGLARAALGITDNLTLETELATAPNRTGARTTGTAAATLAAGFATARVSATRAITGDTGQAFRAVVQAGPVQAQHTYNDGLQTEGLSRTIKHETRIRGLVSMGAGAWGTGDFSYRRTVAGDGVTGALRLSRRWRGVGVIANVMHSRGTGDPRTSLSTAVSKTTSHGDTVSLRVASAVEPEAKLTGVSLGLRRTLTEKVKLQSYAGWTQGGLTGSLGITLRRTYGTAALTLEGSKRGGLARLTLAYGARGGHRVASGGPSFGELAVRVFLDLDNNGQFSPGDRPLQGVKVRGFKTTTDRSGWVADTFTASERLVEVREDDLSDPRWYGPVASRIEVRPGGRAIVGVPVKYRAL